MIEWLGENQFTCKLPRLLSSFCTDDKVSSPRYERNLKRPALIKFLSPNERQSTRDKTNYDNFFFFCQYIFYKDGQIANRS